MSLPLRILSHWVRPKFQHLIFHVTDKCNLRCKHCFVDLTERNTMTAANARDVANTLGRLSWVDIGGGEPFLLDELADLVAPFDCDVLGIPTNGHFPEQIAAATTAILKSSRAKNLVVSVSIEGFEEQHAAIRINKRNYQLALETLRQLRAMASSEPRLRIKCNTVVTNQNSDTLIPFMKYMRESGLLDFHSIILLRGNPHKPEIELPYLENLKRLRPAIFEILDSYLWGSGLLMRGFLRKYYRYLWDVSLDTLEQGTQIIPCNGGQTHLVIWANGDVASCELLPPIGNMHRTPLKTILRGDELGSQVTGIKNNECSCTHNCVMLDSILFNPKNYAAMIAS